MANKTCKQKCLDARDPCRILMTVLSALICFCIIFVNLTKSMNMCWESTPRFLCIANKHCAYMSKDKGVEDETILDLFPFLSENKCVTRES